MSACDNATIDWQFNATVTANEGTTTSESAASIACSAYGWVRVHLDESGCGGAFLQPSPGEYVKFLLIKPVYEEEDSDDSGDGGPGAEGSGGGEEASAASEAKECGVLEYAIGGLERIPENCPAVDFWMLDQSDDQWIPLNETQVFMNGAVCVFPEAPHYIKVRNTTGRKVCVQILVGRDADKGISTRAAPEPPQEQQENH